MARTTSRSRSFVSTRSKRQVDWDITFGLTALVNVPAASKVLLIQVPSATLAVVGPATLVRSRMLLTVASDQSGVSENQIGAFGCSFVNDVAGALGVTGLPGPSTEGGFPGWFVWQPIGQFLRVLSGVGAEPHWGTQYHIDSKAMRKFGSDQDLVIMIENVHATMGFDCMLEGRFLIKSG